MGMLGTHAPATRLPKRAEVFGMIGSRLIALEAIREDGFLGAATKPLPEYSAHVGIFITVVGWSLTSKDMGDVEARRRENGRW